MSNNYLITGFWGEPHITVENDRGINAAIFGQGRFVLPVGNQLKLEYIGNNTVRLYDGKLIDNGAMAGIPTGKYVDLLVSEAGQGMKRNDILVFQYDKNESTLVETGTFVIIKGTETSGTPSDPSISQEDILDDNAFSDQFPLWRIPVSGAVISTPEMLFETKFAGERCYIARSSDGVDYSVSIPGLSKLYNGLEITIIPDSVSTSTNPTLTVNDMDKKNIRIPINSNTSECTELISNNYISANSPVKLIYDENYSSGCWKIVGNQKITANSIVDNIPISRGGTGASNTADARNNLGIYEVSELLELHLWDKYNARPQIEEGEETENIIIGYSSPTSIESSSLTVDYADEIELKNGELSLINPVRLTGDSYDDYNPIKGKYIYSYYRKKFYKIPSDADITLETTGYVNKALKTSKCYEVSPTAQRLNIAYSSYRNQFPDNGSHTDGFWYVYKKMFGD